MSVPAGGEEPQLGPISSLRDCYKAQPRRLQLLFSLPSRDGGGRCQQVAAGLCHKSPHPLPNSSLGQPGMNAQAWSCSPALSLPVLLQGCSSGNGALWLGCCPQPWKGQRSPVVVPWAAPIAELAQPKHAACGCGSPLRLGALLELWDAFGEISVIAGLGHHLSCAQSSRTFVLCILCRSPRGDAAAIQKPGQRTAPPRW